MAKNKQRNKKPNVPKDKMSLSRKALRKQCRKEKKARRSAFYRKNVEDVSSKELSSSNKNVPTAERRVPRRNVQKKRDRNMNELQRANVIEDKIIKKLEKDLKLRKRKGKSIPKMFTTDGLDYVLEACDLGGFDAAHEMGLVKPVEMVPAEDDMELDDSPDSDTDTEGYSSDCSDEPPRQEKKKHSLGKGGKPTKTRTLDQADESMTVDVIQTLDPADESLTVDVIQEKAVQEPLVQNLEVNAEGQLHNFTVSSDENVKQTERQIKGLLNRLAENNVKGIADKFEELYMSHSHNMINTIFARVLMGSLVRPIATPEELIIVYALFTATLHANIGNEIGAFILEALANKFQDLLDREKEEDKQLDAIVLILCHLYDFKVMDALVMYDIMKRLVLTFMEKEVELIILVLKTAGLSLRKEDPEAFKEIMLIIQKKACESAALSTSTRMKFLCDILICVKNNNVLKIPGYDPSRSERLKKLLKGLVKQSIPQLRISLKDLLASEKRGRWWEASVAISGAQKTNHEALYSDKLMKLAKKQGMNTELRQHTFCILMSAEDFHDAYGKLIGMRVKNGQEREVMYVVMHCCLQEKMFNMYYVYVAKQLCQFDRKFRMGAYFTVWDKLKELQNISDFKRVNLAKFLSNLVLQSCLTLSVLKVIDFVSLNKIHVSFLRQTLSEVLLVDSEEAFRQIFKNLTLSTKLVTFRKGLHLFLCHFFKISSKTESNSLHQRVKMAAEILAVDSKLRYQM